MNVTEATLARSSIRAFRAQPVPMPLLREILAVAARSPSGGNLQPWRVYALTNDSLRSLTVAVKVKLAADQIETPEYAVYPANLWEPFRTRRFRAGEELHSKIDVPRADRAARLRQVNRNYAFFDAPVGLIFCIDRRLGAAQWLDLGIFMQTVMLLATERGLATCAQESWSQWPLTVAEVLHLRSEEMVVAGMAIGYPDPSAPINRGRTRREHCETFVHFLGFEL
jgi:nitroreductase